MLSLKTQSEISNPAKVGTQATYRHFICAI